MHLPISMARSSSATTRKHKKNSHHRSSKDSVNAVVFYPDGTRVQREIRRRHQRSLLDQSSRMRHRNGGLITVDPKGVVVDLRVFNPENPAHTQTRSVLQTVFGSDVTHRLGDVTV